MWSNRFLGFIETRVRWLCDLFGGILQTEVEKFNHIISQTDARFIWLGGRLKNDVLGECLCFIENRLT